MRGKGQWYTAIKWQKNCCSHKLSRIEQEFKNMFYTGMPQEALTVLMQCPLFHFSYVSSKMTKIPTLSCCLEQQIKWAPQYCFLILVSKMEIWIPQFSPHTCILTYKIELSLGLQILEKAVYHCTGHSDQALVFVYFMQLARFVYTFKEVNAFNQENPFRNCDNGCHRNCQ